MLVKALLLFVFGTAIGSFLNVLIARLPKEEKITGWSYCPVCKHRLFLFDLIPLLSFVLLGRSCRYCGKKIAWQYPLVEFITGAGFAVLGELVTLGSFRDFVGLVLMCVIASCAIVLFFADLNYRVVPESIILIGVLAVIVFRALFVAEFYPALLAGLGAAGFFFMLHLLGRIFSSTGWMGFGDVELAFLVGLVSSWPLVVVSLFFSFLTGALVSITLLLKKEKQIKPALQLKQTVPFGPFLVLGTLLALFFGNDLLTWYLGFI